MTMLRDAASVEFPGSVELPVTFRIAGLVPVICSKSLAKLFSAMCTPTKSSESAKIGAPAISSDPFPGVKLTNFCSRSAWLMWGQSATAPSNNPLARMMGLRGEESQQEGVCVTHDIYRGRSA